MLQLINLSKIYYPGAAQQRIALQDLTLTVTTGQWVSVIGSNGAGKSSLLKSISGELMLSQGEVIINHRSITAFSPDLRAPYISRVFQDPELGTIGEMTVSENLCLSYRRGQKARFCLSPTAAQKKLFQERLSPLNMGLENRLENKVGELSGGQRQALCLIMATLRQPDLLLLDEHCAALDPKSAQTVMALTQQVVNSLGVTTLVATHNMRDALQFGDRLIMLDQGKIIRDYDATQKAGLSIDHIHHFFEHNHVN